MVFTYCMLIVRSPQVSFEEFREYMKNSLGTRGSHLLGAQHRQIWHTESPATPPISVNGESDVFLFLVRAALLSHRYSRLLQTSTMLFQWKPCVTSHAECPLLCRAISKLCTMLSRRRTGLAAVSLFMRCGLSTDTNVFLNPKVWFHRKTSRW